MNILDKSCRAMAPTFGSEKSSVAKREKFSWAAPSKPGVFREIKKSDLNIDGAYQRDQVSKEKVAEIARNWDWKLFGALSVIQRPDASFWVFDGGNRARAAFFRDDIEALPCMVFQAEDLAEEAKAFIGTNTMVHVVSAFHMHRAAVLSGEPVAVAAQEVVEKHGYAVDRNHERKFSFSAISALEKCVKENPAVAEMVFGLCASIAQNGEPISGTVLKGLFRCQIKLQGKADIGSSENLEKLRRETLPGIQGAIRRETAIMGKGGEYIFAKAVLDLLNKGRRRRIAFA